MFKTKEEFEEYRMHINSSYNKEKTHKPIRYSSDTIIANANKTSDRDADKGASWIDYWKAMTGHYENNLYCSSCGKEIFTGPIPKEKLEQYKKDGDDSSHLAEGGHLWIVSKQIPGGRYITPLCPKCNAQRGEKIIIKKGSLIFKELGAKVVDKND